MLLVRYGDNFALKYASQTPMRTTARQVVVSRDNCILAGATKGFRSVRIYTVGKQRVHLFFNLFGFRSVRIYTVGKLDYIAAFLLECFRSVRIYTVGKRKGKHLDSINGFRSVHI